VGADAPGGPYEDERMDPLDVARALADPRRMRALAAVALGARDADAVAEHTGRSVRETSEAVHRLRDSGLITDDAIGMAVDYDALRTLVRDAAPAAASAGHGLSPFIEGRRLRSLPAARERRWSVLAHVATHALELGRDYTERELVARLAEWCNDGPVDTSALRRYLVEERLVSRGSGLYRLGGDGPPLSKGEQLMQGMGLT